MVLKIKSYLGARIQQLLDVLLLILQHAPGGIGCSEQVGRDVERGKRIKVERWGGG
jgi:hypothetical protein